MGVDITSALLDILNNNGDLFINDHTDLVMILKIRKPTFSLQFHPISLSIVIYKTSSRVLVNRRRIVMLVIVGNFQSVFVLGLSIFNNIITIHEVDHFMNL